MRSLSHVLQPSSNVARDSRFFKLVLENDDEQQTGKDMVSVAEIGGVVTTVALIDSRFLVYAHSSQKIVSSLTSLLAVEMDSAAINGTEAASQPRGILNPTGGGAVTLNALFT